MDLAAVTGSLDQVEEAVASYDPAAFFTDGDARKANVFLSDFSQAIDAAKQEMNAAQSENTDKLSKAMSDYSAHVSDLRAAVYDAYNAEREHVEEAINMFVTVKRGTSAENQALIADFSTKMPNSRANAAVNQKVVEFVAEPVLVEHEKVRSVEAAGAMASGMDNRMLLALFGVCLAALLISTIMRSRQARAAAKGRQA
jgi:hypothetical protein